MADELRQKMGEANRQFKNVLSSLGEIRTIAHWDLAPFEQLVNALRRPFDEDPALSRYAEPAPGEFMAEFRTFCGT